MSLAPWDMCSSGGEVWFDLVSNAYPRQFRVRRPSYVLATQLARVRNETGGNGGNHRDTDVVTTRHRPRSLSSTSVTAAAAAPEVVGRETICNKGTTHAIAFDFDEFPSFEYNNIFLSSLLPVSNRGQKSTIDDNVVIGISSNSLFGNPRRVSGRTSRDGYHVNDRTTNFIPATNSSTWSNHTTGGYETTIDGPGISPALSSVGNRRSMADTSFSGGQNCNFNHPHLHQMHQQQYQHVLQQHQRHQELNRLPSNETVVATDRFLRSGSEHHIVTDDDCNDAERAVDYNSADGVATPRRPFVDRYQQTGSVAVNENNDNEGEEQELDEDEEVQPTIDPPAEPPPSNPRAISSQTWRNRKNLLSLSVGFLLIFTAFRSIQALETTIYASGRLGAITMATVHGSMALVCPLLAPTVAMITSSSSNGGGGMWAKWMLVLAGILYVGWVTANLYPHPTTLLPASVLAGVAQCIAWAALISYMRALVQRQKADSQPAVDFDNHSYRKSSVSTSAAVVNDDNDDSRRRSSTPKTPMTSRSNSRKKRRRRCHAPSAMIFVVCFQTSHVFGNLLSSLMLSTGHVNTGLRPVADNTPPTPLQSPSTLAYDTTGAASNGKLTAAGGGEKTASQVAGMKYEGTGDIELVRCGVYDSCELIGMAEVWDPSATVVAAQGVVIKLMGCYLALAVLGLTVLLVLLENIGASSKANDGGDCPSGGGATVDRTKTSFQVIRSNIVQLYRRVSFLLLVPLLVFNGFEQGFIYSDFTRSFVACNLGVEYIGYSMLTFGVSNFMFSIAVGLLARHVATEAIVGIAAVLQFGLIVFLLVWIPDRQLAPVFFVISALWGLCDAIWQIQCNCLVSISCPPSEHDVAFQNCRTLQGLGAALAFGLSAVSTGSTCVAVKLYLLIGLLAVSLVSYSVFEYRMRQTPPENSGPFRRTTTTRAMAVHAMVTGSFDDEATTTSPTVVGSTRDQVANAVGRRTSL